MEVCGKEGPNWFPHRTCVKPFGHTIKVKFVKTQNAKKKRKVVVSGTGHITADGREWPISYVNIEFL